MDKVTITRPVVVKVRVTDEYKKALAAEIQDAIKRLDVQLQHLEFQARRIVAELEKKNPQDVPVARQQMEQERSRRLEARQKLVEKLKDVARLTPGEEVIHGQVESIVEVKVGDDWRQVMGVEIVLQDSLVMEIRQTGRDVLNGR